MASDAPSDRVVDPENVAGLINPIMLKYQLKPQDVKKERGSVQDVHGRGEYECKLCNYIWKSYFSWISVDLMDQRIVKRWAMKCKHCMNILKPTFSLKETDKMIEKAVCQYLGVRYRSGNDSGRPRMYRMYIEPHLSRLCEKCRWGQIECWT